MAVPKTFTGGERLFAADLNDNFEDLDTRVEDLDTRVDAADAQGVRAFADASARDTAIPSPTEGMVTYLDDTNEVLKYDGSAWSSVAPEPTPLDSVEVITATNASWTVPSLGTSIVRVTAVGGGGGANGSGGTPNAGSGGDTSFGAYGTASGGGGGRQSDDTAVVGGAGFRSGNEGGSIYSDGQGGEVKSFYVDLTGVSTVAVTIGAGGTGTNGGSNGGRGEVIVEYRAV